MKFVKYVFTPNRAKYEGVRPINIYFLRILYALMFAGVALDAWTTIINHQGPWDPTRAVGWSVWAAYPTLSIFGLLRPLRWLPLIIFMIFYKTLWVILVAYPLWSTNTLAGSPAEEMTYVFIAAPFFVLVVPWVYVFKNFVFKFSQLPERSGLQESQNPV